MSTDLNSISAYLGVATSPAASSVQSARGGGTFEALGRLQAGLNDRVAQLLLLPPSRSPVGFLPGVGRSSERPPCLTPLGEQIRELENKHGYRYAPNY